MVPMRQELLDRLGLPPEPEWPQPWKPDLEPLPWEEDDDALEAEAAELEKELQKQACEEKRRRVVYRVITRQKLPVGGSFMLLCLSGIAYGLIGGVTESAALGAIAGIGMFVGVIFWLRTDVELRCSECREKISEDATRCAECGFRVGKTVGSVEEAEALPEYD